MAGNTGDDAFVPARLSRAIGEKPCLHRLNAELRVGIGNPIRGFSLAHRPAEQILDGILENPA